MVNKVTLIGNLGRDPEVRTTSGGQSVCTLNLATTDKRKDKDGAWVEHTEWHSVVVWGKTADNVATYCKKGKQLYIDGRLTTRKWQDKEGKERYTTEVVAETVKFLGGGERQGGGEDRGRGGQQERQQEPRQGPRAATTWGEEGTYVSPSDDQDIPF